MSFMEKVKFWKKEEDFSFDDPSLGGQISPSQDPLAPMQDSMSVPNPLGEMGEVPPLDVGGDFSNPNPEMSKAQAFVQNNPINHDISSDDDHFAFDKPTQLPNQNSTDLSNPLSNQNSNSSQGSVGKNLAQNYIQNQQAAPLNQEKVQHSIQSTEMHTLEVINLKLDAIRSELSATNQRILKLEGMLEKQQKKSW